MNIFYKRTARLCCGFLAIASGMLLSGVDLNAGRLQRAKELSNRPKPPVRPRGFLANISHRTEKGYALLAVAGLATLGIVGYSIYAANNESASDGDNGLPDFPADTDDAGDSPADSASVVATGSHSSASYSAYPASSFLPTSTYVPSVTPSTPASVYHDSELVFMPPASSTICRQTDPSPVSSPSEQFRRERLEKERRLREQEAEEQRRKDERIRKDRADAAEKASKDAERRERLEKHEQEAAAGRAKQRKEWAQQKMNRDIQALVDAERVARSGIITEDTTEYGALYTQLYAPRSRQRDAQIKLLQEEGRIKAEERRKRAQDTTERLRKEAWELRQQAKLMRFTQAQELARKEAAERQRQEEQQNLAKKQAELAQQQGLKQKLEEASGNLDNPISQDLWNEVSKVLNSTWTDTFGHQRRIHFCSGDSYPGSIVAGARTGCDAPAVPNKYTPQWWATASVEEINVAKKEHQKLVEAMAAAQKAEAERQERERCEKEELNQKVILRRKLVNNLVAQGVYLQLKQDFTCQGFELKEVFGFRYDLIPDCFDILPGWQGHQHFQDIKKKEKLKTQIFLNWVYYNYQLDKQGFATGDALDKKLLESVQNFMALYEDFYNQKLSDLRAGYGSGDQGVPPQGPSESPQAIDIMVQHFFRPSMLDHCEEECKRMLEKQLQTHRQWLCWLDGILPMFLTPAEWANFSHSNTSAAQRQEFIGRATNAAREAKRQRLAQQQQNLALHQAYASVAQQRVACARR